MRLWYNLNKLIGKVEILLKYCTDSKTPIWELLPCKLPLAILRRQELKYRVPKLELGNKLISN